MMKRLLVWLAVLLSGFAVAVVGEDNGNDSSDGADALNGAQPKVFVLEVDGAIGPASTDYITRGLRRAADEGARMVILRMDTPGGLDNSMRDIIRAIIDSSVPVATYVAPGGARAASAGTYILYASHVAAMAPGTNLGAATPVQMGGMPGGGDDDPLEEADETNGDEANGEEANGEATDDEAAEEEAAPASGDAMERKLINDAVAYIRSLADMRERNADWAEKAVRESASLGSREALEMNVIDMVAEDLNDLLAQADGREVKVGPGTAVLETAGLQIEVIEPDWRNELLAVITNPNVAYILMLVGIYGLIFELANPGAIVPGVLGSISILLALFAFQALPINYAGLALMLLGAAFMVAEAFMPSFGILGIGGVAAFVMGSLLLVDTGVEAYELSMSVIIGVTAVSFVVLFGIATMALRAHRRKVTWGAEQMAESVAVAESDFLNGRGKVRIWGELWNAELDEEVTVRKGDRLKVTAVDGLKVHVVPALADDGRSDAPA